MNLRIGLFEGLIESAKRRGLLKNIKNAAWRMLSPPKRSGSKEEKPSANESAMNRRGKNISRELNTTGNNHKDMV